MAALRVWAPRAQTVEVTFTTTDGQRQPRVERLPMRKLTRGWWEIVSSGLVPGVEYAFVIDGSEELLPDPRSPWQPNGIHGQSRLLDHGTFAWRDDGWKPPPLSAGIIYELHIGTFTATGTCVSAIERLDHLVDLGITYVELMPVQEFSGTRGWGYDGVDLYAPHHAYGGPDGLKTLVDACHQRGLGVLLDVVYNHLGPSGNYLDRFGPYFTERYRTPWGSAVNLDGAGSDEVRRFLCDNALMWLRDYHIDGLRIDAVHAFVDMSAVHFLEQLATEVDALAAERGRPYVLIAESDLNDPRIIRSRAEHGYGIHFQWNDDLHHAVHAVLTGEHTRYYADFGRLADIAAAFEHGFVRAGSYSAFRNRRHGQPLPPADGRRLVGFLQNHDQVGNRAAGERIGHLVSCERVKVGAALVMMAPSVPLIFQGEEWGASSPFLYFTDHQDAELGRQVTEARRREFEGSYANAAACPDPQARATFDRSKLDWTEIDRSPHHELLRWYHDLIALRRRVAALHDGSVSRTHATFDEHARWLRVERGPIAILCNLGVDPQDVPVSGEQVVLLVSGPGIACRQGRLLLPADSVAILGPLEVGAQWQVVRGDAG